MGQNIQRSSFLQNCSSIYGFKESLRVIRHLILREKLQLQGTPFKLSNHTALVFAPHPDDETLGCGGFIALKHILGAQVEVIILTDGSACFGPLPPATAKALAERRAEEAVHAMQALGVPKTQIHFLNQPDGQLSSLTSSERNNLLVQLIELLELYRPQEILVPHQLDNTADHEVTFDLVLLALKTTSLKPLILQYPIWRFWNGPLLDIKIPFTPDLKDIWRLDISRVLEKKREAFACYESQYSATDEISSKNSLPARFEKAFELKYEIYFRLGDTKYGSDCNHLSSQKG